LANPQGPVVVVVVEVIQPGEMGGLVVRLAVAEAVAAERNQQRPEMGEQVLTESVAFGVGSDGCQQAYKMVQNVRL